MDHAGLCRGGAGRLRPGRLAGRIVCGGHARTGLEPGAWTLRADVDGYRPLVRVIELSAAEPVRREDLVLEPAVVLTVKAFTPGGERLFDALRSEFEPDGAFWSLRVTAVATREPPAGDLPEISQRSYDRYGIGFYRDRMDWENLGRKPTVFPTDSIGILELDEPLPGYVSLVLRAPEHEMWASRVRVPVGGTADLGTVELDAATTIAGMVLDGDGRPQSVTLKVAPVDRFEDAEPVLSRWMYKSDADGAFAIGHLGRRKYELRVTSGEWAAPPVVVDTYAGDVDDARVVVVPGALLRINTLWPAGTRYRVRVTTADGVLASDTDAWDGSWNWSKRLVPGGYVVALMDGSRTLKTLPVTLGAEDRGVDLSP